MAFITAHGWAVLTADGIDLRTVCDTRRAAIVNWLCTSGNVLIHRGTTDRQIEAIWREHCGNVCVVQVKVQYDAPLNS